MRRVLAFLTIAALGLAPATVAQAVPIGPFQTQAEAAGRSRAEQRELQRLVDRELADRGGVQVAANRVEWDGGDTMFPLPGEKRVRDLTRPGQVSAQGDPSTCQYERLCVYAQEGYNGAQTSFYVCEKRPVGDFWSYVNNQSGRAKGTFYDIFTVVHYVTPAAWHAEYRYDGRPVYKIKAC